MMDSGALNKIFRGRYVVERELGHGGMGTVFLGRSETIQRPVAIKVLRDAGDDAEHLERFLREARLLSRFDHPNIVPVIDLGAEEGVAYFVMPLVVGESLEALLKQGPLSETEALKIAIAVASALDYAHKAGVIHRDIKPSNVLVPTGDGRAAKLTDFGMQGTLDASTQQTKSGQIFGTVTYMAPEQITGQPQTSATDVFGLGTLLFQMIYGRAPYSGDLVQVINRILREPVVLPDAPPITQPLRDFITRCLDKVPENRPHSALRELERIESQQVVDGPTIVVAAPAPSSVRAPAPASASGSGPAPVLPTVRKTAIHLHPVVAAAGAVLLSVSALLAMRSSPGAVQAVTGLGLVVGGVLLGIGVRERLLAQKVALGDEASRILVGTRTRADLSQSLAIEVNHLMERCKSVDERFLGTSIAIMIDEFYQAQGFDDRHRALAASVEFLEKLMRRLSPWYVRYEKLIATMVALLGIVPGVLKIVQTLSGP